MLGCASIAERRMLPSMLAQPRVELVAVASRHAEKAERFARLFGCEAVTGYERLLAREDIDAVYVPLPPSLHAEWVRRALLAGKHVLCEKPFAATLAEAESAVALARDRGLLVMESFMFLHHRQHAEVRRLLDEGLIGEPRGFSADFGIPLLDGGGGHASTLPEVAVYPIRVAEFFLGWELEVLGAYERCDAAGEFAVAGDAMLRAPSGVIAHLRYGLEHGYRAEYTWWGSAGTLTVRRAFSTPDDHAPVLRVECRSGVEDLVLKPDSQFVNIAGFFAEAVLDGGEFRTHADAILRHAELLDRVRVAAQLGG
ncbi:Predicted dehydrogenase [Amycolatopsis xylanica]|uniref:Predicted dehydrogenase n=1 Tax=Amycolatopsis xylanica TaxID=589385 RepID=A0A1H2VQN3_9PSEU|nr:Predicted dehydrogenase [Amycolatopsis xylanica]